MGFMCVWYTKCYQKSNLNKMYVIWFLSFKKLEVLVPPLLFVKKIDKLVFYGTSTLVVYLIPNPVFFLPLSLLLIYKVNSL